MNRLELGLRVLVHGRCVVFFVVDVIEETRNLGQLTNFEGKYSIDIVPAKFVLCLVVGDSNEVFPHLYSL